MKWIVVSCALVGLAASGCGAHRASPRPNATTAKTGGFRMVYIRPDSIFGRLGLQNGDVVISIDGVEVTAPGPEGPAPMLLPLARHPSVVVVERSGKRIELRPPPGVDDDPRCRCSNWRDVSFSWKRSNQEICSNGADCARVLGLVDNQCADPDEVEGGPWCYTSSDCPSAVRSKDGHRAWRYCGGHRESTTNLSEHVVE